MLLIICEIGSVCGDDFKMIRNHLEIIAAEHVCRFEVDPATELTILRAIITVSLNLYG